MSRTFHNSSGPLFALTATMVIALAGYFLWMKMAAVGAVVLLVAVLLIERTIHTEYIVDDNQLTIRRGRLSRATVVPLGQIAAANLFRPAPLLLLIRRRPIVVVVLRAKPRPLLLTPANPDEFIKALWKKKKP